MIYGIGTDLVEIPRVERVLERFGARFARRILCEPELRRFRAHTRPASYLAKRFAGIAARAGKGGVWISWPKKASGIPTDLTEDVLREVLLPKGWVDVKVCAVDAIYSGLHFRKRRT